ncbi:MAG: hypothetical protein R2867_05480 [Caldilineaceae bacterium]
MSTWRIGDSWITTSGLTVGTAGSKLRSQQDAHERKHGAVQGNGGDSSSTQEVPDETH